MYKYWALSSWFWLSFGQSWFYLLLLYSSFPFVLPEWWTTLFLHCRNIVLSLPIFVVSISVLLLVCQRNCTKPFSDLSGQNFHSFSCPARQWQRWIRERTLLTIRAECPFRCGKQAELNQMIEISCAMSKQGDYFCMWDGMSGQKICPCSEKPFPMKALIEALLTPVRINWWFQMKIKLKFCHCF